MPEILIRCPVTKKQVSTGIILNAEVFARLDFKDRPVYCPHCGRKHLWDKRDAFLWR